jgi:hypothetical protein
MSENTTVLKIDLESVSFRPTIGARLLEARARYEWDHALNEPAVSIALRAAAVAGEIVEADVGFGGTLRLGVSDFGVRYSARTRRWESSFYLFQKVP